LPKIMVVQDKAELAHAAAAEEPVLGELVEESMHTRTLRAKLPASDRGVLVTCLKPVYRSDAVLLAALRRQGELLARLDHPGLPTLLGPVQIDGAPALAFVDHHGHRLCRLLEAGQHLDAACALAVALGVVAPLSAIHRSGDAHGAIRPSAIELTEGGAVYLHDYGWRTPGERGGDGDSLVLPEHMAPEQLVGEPGDARSDVFQLGMLLYRMVTGRPAFDSATGRISQSIRHSAPPPLHRHAPAAPAKLDQIVSRCLQKRPRDRYPDVASVASALVAVLRVHTTEPLDVLVSRAVATAGLGEALPAPAEGGARARSGLVRRSLRKLGAPFVLVAAALAIMALLVVSLDEPPAGGGAGARGIVKRPARLRLLATPWAEVYVDGRQVAVTPVARPIAVSPGSHQVMFKHPNAPTEERSIEVIAGQTLLLEVQMQVTRPRDAGRPDAGLRDETP